MRLAWTIKRSAGLDLGEAQRRAWQALRADPTGGQEDPALRAAGQLVDLAAAVLSRAARRMRESFASSVSCHLELDAGAVIGKTIDELIALLDRMDGDADFEPSLGISEIVLDEKSEDKSSIGFDLSRLNCRDRTETAARSIDDLEEGDDTGIADACGLQEQLSRIASMQKFRELIFANT